MKLLRHTFILKIINGHKSANMLVELQIFFSAYCLMVLYILTSFLKISQFKGYGANKDDVGLMDMQMDIQMDRMMNKHSSKGIKKLNHLYYLLFGYKGL